MGEGKVKEEKRKYKKNVQEGEGQNQWKEEGVGKSYLSAF